MTGENAGRTVFQVRYSGDLVSELRKIFSPNSDNYDAVGGKLEVYSGKVGELTFKCLPAVTVNTINEDSAVSTTPGVMNLNTVVTKILNDYVPSKKETFAGHQMGSFFRSDIPLAIYETGISSVFDNRKCRPGKLGHDSMGLYIRPEDYDHSHKGHLHCISTF